MGLEKTEGYTTGSHFAKEVLGGLRKAGINLTEATALSFYLYLPTRKAARACEPLLVQEGLTVEIEKSAADDGQWLCLCHRTFVPTQKALKQIGDRMLSLAEMHAGRFDGWETNPYASMEGFMGLLEEMAKVLGKSRRA
jgi:hypothetical protein